ncbi:alkaline phosphatase D family protein [Sphingosinicella terrae]|uniref:alkaline phosphatase D family protein n=1 Tax=Sphingosinicella terrae TaxID=2172047 RepID=UPI000E0DC38D|nr:alkaline phosphatase D family protein [Sphingosinicella terrae]
MLSRRHFIAGATASLVAAPAILRAQSIWRDYPFSLGVAAGDPAADGFVIWTRLAPRPLDPHGGMAMAPMPVKWQVATEPRFDTVVREGEALARPELGHSVHVELEGLEPDRPYWYRFEAGGERSINGQARTLPRTGAAPEALRFGVAGCQNYEAGFYTAYRHLAEEELAFVYHYGDYIYEYRGDAIRPGWSGDLIVAARQGVGQDAFDLADYRQRYALYKSDPDLQRAHAAFAFFHTFDDHEVTNNWVQDIDPDGAPPELFRTRRAMALQAWYENLPVRRTMMPRFGATSAHRQVRYGDLAEIDLLDTRQYRSDQPCGDGFRPVCAEVTSADAQVLGAEQEAWLARNLSRSQARWNCLAQQVMMMSVDRRRTPDEAPEKLLNLDTWAAYEVPRQRLLARLRGLDNVVVLTGDEHQNWAGELHDDRDRRVAVEFVATSISSGGDGSDLRPGSDHILAANPQLKFLNDQRGYLTCDVGRDEWRTNFMVVDRVSTPGGALSKRATWAVARGETTLRQA